MEQGGTEDLGYDNDLVKYIRFTVGLDDDEAMGLVDRINRIVRSHYGGNDREIMNKFSEAIKTKVPDIDMRDAMENIFYNEMAKLIEARASKRVISEEEYKRQTLAKQYGTGLPPTFYHTTYNQPTPQFNPTYYQQPFLQTQQYPQSTHVSPIVSPKKRTHEQRDPSPEKQQPLHKEEKEEEEVKHVQQAKRKRSENEKARSFDTFMDHHISVKEDVKELIKDTFSELFTKNSRDDAMVEFRRFLRDIHEGNAVSTLSRDKIWNKTLDLFGVHPIARVVIDDMEEFIDGLLRNGVLENKQTKQVVLNHIKDVFYNGNINTSQLLTSGKYRKSMTEFTKWINGNRYIPEADVKQSIISKLKHSMIFYDTGGGEESDEEEEEEEEKIPVQPPVYYQPQSATFGGAQSQTVSTSSSSVPTYNMVLESVKRAISNDGEAQRAQKYILKYLDEKLYDKNTSANPTQKGLDEYARWIAENTNFGYNFKVSVIEALMRLLSNSLSFKVPLERMVQYKVFHMDIEKILKSLFPKDKKKVDNILKYATEKLYESGHPNGSSIPTKNSLGQYLNWSRGIVQKQHVTDEQRKIIFNKFAYMAEKLFGETGGSGGTSSSSSSSHSQTITTNVSSNKTDQMIAQIQSVLANGKEYIHFYMNGLTAFLGNFYPVDITMQDYISSVYYKNPNATVRTFPCAEAAFQAQKFPLELTQGADLIQEFDVNNLHKVKKHVNNPDHECGEKAFTLGSEYGGKSFGVMYPKGGQAKHIYGTNQTWHTGIKDDVMLAILRIKFPDTKNANGELVSPLSRLLAATGSCFLVEHNEKKGRDSYWSDDFDGAGKNMLGRLLMIVRNGFGIQPYDDSNDSINKEGARYNRQYWSDLHNVGGRLPTL